MSTIEVLSRTQKIIVKSDRSIAIVNAGPIGPPGAIGPEGPPGEQGIQGSPGPQGAQGEVGPQGPQGDVGPTGSVGPEGLVWRGNWEAETVYVIDDSVGHNGSSFIAIANNTGSEPPSSSWTLLSSQGDVGPTGPMGPQGIQGPIGPEGPEGPEGPQGIQGPIGPEGPQGIQGEPGTDADVTAHTGDTDGAHAASAVSFSDSGLVVVAGTTNVQSAIAAIDVLTRPSSGTIAARPDPSTVPSGKRYLATDVDGGTEYEQIGGVWVQIGAGVNGGGGGRELQRVELAQADTSGALADWPGATFAAALPVSSLAVDIHLHIPYAFVTTWVGGETAILQVLVVDTAGLGHSAQTYGIVSRFRPAGNAASSLHTQQTNAQIVIPEIILRRPAGAPAANYKVQIGSTVGGNTIRITDSIGTVGANGKPFMSAKTVAA